jgi:[acyl-carrier-protein] S-malonyltransferase
MASDLIDTQHDIFDEASDTLGVDVAELCREGRSGSSTLETTRWAQPAILATSVASAREHAARGTTFDVLAGHSLGEYAALVVAGSLSVGDGVRLVALRAEAMDRASVASPGGMAAILGLEVGVVQNLCDQAGAVIAGDNAPGQIVISGPHEAIDRVLVEAKALRGKAVKVNVSGAFHSPAMENAVAELSAVLDDARVAEPRIPVWSPTTALPVSKVAEIKAALVKQLTRPVLWRRTIQGLVERGANWFVDVGPGAVVAGMVKRIAPQVQIESGAPNAHRQ